MLLLSVLFIGLLKQRLQMLSELKRIAAAAAEGKQPCSSLLCLDVASYLLLEKLSAAPAKAFPEHRLRWVIDAANRLLLVRPPATCSRALKACAAVRTGANPATTAVGGAGGGSGGVVSGAAACTGTTGAAAGVGREAESRGTGPPAPACYLGATVTEPQVVREGFPVWCGVPPVPVISWGAALELLEDQLWFEPFNASDARKLIVQGVQVRVSGTQGDGKVWI